MLQLEVNAAFLCGGQPSFQLCVYSAVVHAAAFEYDVCCYTWCRVPPSLLWLWIHGR